MTQFEKIKAMDVDELAEFIELNSRAGGFYDHACLQCPQHVIDGCCSSNNLKTDCTAALKSHLLREVHDDGTV